jgi:hypothetical protein
VFKTRKLAVTEKTASGLELREVLMNELYLCAMCKVRDVWGKGIDRSRPAVRYRNPVDKLTSTVSWPSIPGKYCYFCEKKHDGLIKL